MIHALYDCDRRRRKEFRRICPRFAGCVAVGETEAEVKQLTHEAIEFHFEDLQASGAEIQKPLSRSESTKF